MATTATTETSKRFRAKKPGRPPLGVKKERVNLSIEKGVLKRSKTLARKNGESLSEMVERLLLAEMKRVNRKS